MHRKLPIAFLWHMHQPLYKDLVSGKYHLPWVRLHSTYSYLDMAAIIDKYPKAKCTFNITPSLIWQLKDISSGEPVDDVFLELTAKNADGISEDEKIFILRNFFSCDWKRAVASSRRYVELLEKRGEDPAEGALRVKSPEFSSQDMRDLQVLFNLAWCGFTLRGKDPLIKELVEKGAGYTEDDKKNLLEHQAKTVKSILPLYKRLQDEGKIEISTTPFYHPILPLLCGDSSGRGIDHKDDAKVHVKKAIALYEEVFGRKPEGMWPAEGSVSQQIIPILADEGIKWIASDEGIVIESFRGEDIPRGELIYNAFTAEEDGRSIDIVFRDINISNAISFKYSNFSGKKAFHDMYADLKGIAKSFSHDKREHLVPVILDGENPWPYYPDGGQGFLAATYKKLSASDSMEMVTIGQYLKNNGERKRIGKLFSGSWINRNFDKWSGSPQKDKAWEYLQKAREAAFADGVPSPEVLEELYIAEGSDWFWWYDEFGTELNLVYDDLFRLHLSNVYKLMGQEEPHYLKEAVPSTPGVRKLPAGGARAEMASMPNVLFVSSETVPFSKTGGLADVAGSLPRALAELGCDVRVVTPLYRCVTDLDFELIKEAENVKCPFPDGTERFDVYSARENGVTFYFVRNKKYYDRAGLYGTASGDYHDNACRFSFFSKAALGTADVMGFRPDVIHCNDWQSALIPFYLKYKLTDSSIFRHVKTLFTIHNMAYQGVFKKKMMKKAGIPEKFFNMNDLEFYGKLNFMKAGILYSDAINTVSYRYAEEIMTSQYGAGLDGLVRSRKDVLYGIPNGVDYSVWSPKNDSQIKANYDLSDVSGKVECKKDLLEYTGLDISMDAPLIGSVTRLAEQKGMDLVAKIMDRITALGAGVVVLGNGDARYNRIFADLVSKYPGKVYVCNSFNDELAHKIESGCDMFLMPSRYEPCGLNQMYSTKYGTIPIVRATGGLDDAIVDYDAERELSNGFKFGPADPEALYKAIERAVTLYKDKDEWKALIKRAMKCDFSWERSAGQYLSLYNKLTS
ncbi:MAG: glycogen synthase GlgA [Candidatus Tantalella remota]|nr:glycogen synthase GlgA [Candidatus Tantalella remota]